MTSETQQKHISKSSVIKKAFLRAALFLVLFMLGLEVYEHHFRTDQPYRSLTEMPFFGLLPQEFTYQEETVATSDGYLLRVFVVIHPDKLNKNLPPVLLQHGYGSSGVNFLLNGDQSVAFILANKGYKSYIVNGRGTPLSLNHTSLLASSPAFWQYSFEDLALDSVAVLEHIYSREKRRVVYMGHSQGAAQFLAGASKSETADKFHQLVYKAVLFAPVWCMKQATSYPVVLARSVGDSLEYFSKVFGLVHLGKLRYPEGTLADWKETIINKVCGLHHKLCFLALLETDHSNEFNSMHRYGTWIRYHMTSASLKGGLHFGQVSRDAQNGTCTVSSYDYGEATNLKVYFRKKPPVFDISTIRIPVQMYMGTEDRFFGADDEDALRKKVQGNTNFQVFQYPGWGHQSFVFGPDLGGLFNNIHKFVTG